MNQSPNPVIGASAEATVVVTQALTVNHVHSIMPRVFATPQMILLMEIASSRAVQSSLPDGWVSVGVDVNIRHLAATPVGETVTARAVITAVNSKLVTFDVEAHDGTNLIGKGTHTRAPIELARFERSLAARERK